jgi:hypothetical protein
MPNTTTGSQYFDINDATIFKEKVEQSLKEQKGKGFNPKNTILNPGEHILEHIFMGLPQNKPKRGWLYRQFVLGTRLMT